MVDSKIFIANLSSRVILYKLIDNRKWLERLFLKIWKNCASNNQKKKRSVYINIFKIWICGVCRYKKRRGSSLRERLRIHGALNKSWARK